MRTSRVIALAMAMALTRAAVAAEDPAPDAQGGYPPDYGRLVAAAEREGRLEVYGNGDAAQIRALVQDFRQLHPAIRLVYRDLDAAEIHSRVMAETATGGSADLVWSSAMQLQATLVDEGYARNYVSPEKSHLPAWSVWRDEAYGVTCEPVAILYDKRRVPPGQVPRSHAALTRLLETQAAQYRGRVGALDPERSPVGYQLIAQDAASGPADKRLVRALGAVGVRLYDSSATLIERVVTGDLLIAYDIPAAPAVARARRSPNLGIVYPEDYTLAISRIAFIAREARHPAAAKVFLDYLLSRRGQRILADTAQLFPVRADIEGGVADSLRRLGDRLHPIVVGPRLRDGQDRSARQRLLDLWLQALQGKSPLP